MDEPIRRQVTPAPGRDPKEGLLVDVRQSHEHWSQYFLADGTILRIKPLVTEVVRLDDELDSAGNPTYVLKATLITAVIKGSGSSE